MQFTLRTTAALHDEHVATLALLNNLESILLSHGPKNPPDPTNTSASRLFSDMTTAIEGEIERHFAFEEDSIFPRLAEMGDGDICSLLQEEHEHILPTAKELAIMIRAARTDGFEPAEWARFRQMGLEFLELLITHIQKEEMGLLPVLEDILDSDADAALAIAYTGGHTPGSAN